MAVWEYKIITSGKGGFATPALLEKFLNDLGREEWEIVEFRSAPDNPLAFTGLARRPTQRDWTLEDAAAAAARAEAEKLRAEFSAKFQAATSNGPAGEEKAPSFLEERVAPDDGFRKPIDTSRDSDPDASDEETAEKDEWEKLESEDELPSFFDALKPHMRRNQRGPGMSVGIDYLARKWGLEEGDIRGALVECGLQIPADENAKPDYVEFDGDLYWVNINRRGEVWINTREKPRPVFRVVQATKVAPEAAEESKPENKRQKSPERAQRAAEKAERREEAGQRTEAVRRQRDETTAAQPEMPVAPAPEAAAEQAETPAAPVPLPEGTALLEKIRPMMRRNRRGPGGSGSASYLARALKTSESDLIAAFAALGLALPGAANEAPKQVEIGNSVWWLNQDSRGGVWINGREKRGGEAAKSAAPKAAPADVAETAPASAEATDAVPAPEVAAASAEPPALAQSQETLPLERAGSTGGAPAETATERDAAAADRPPVRESADVFAAVRLLLKETRTGGLAGKVDRVAEELGKSADELTLALVDAGLKVPEKPREKPVFVEHAGEIFWFNRNAKGELWVNAKASKFSDKSGGTSGEAGDESTKRPRRGGRSRKPASGDPAPANESAPRGDEAPTTDRAEPS